MSSAAVVVVLDGCGNVLWLRRGRTAPTYPGCWNMPGGYVQAGESPLAGARRELYEEAGLHVSLDCFWPLARIGDIWSFVVQFVGRPRVVCLDGEHDAFRWCRPVWAPGGCVPGARALARQGAVMMRFSDARVTAV